MTEQKRFCLLIDLIGLIAGLLLSFGGLVLMFEYAESGTNSEVWQLLLGLVAPILLLAFTNSQIRRRHPGRKFSWRLWTATLIGFGLGLLAASFLP